MMTTTELATAFDTTPRNLRKFLRSDASGIAPVGKGSRYALPSGKRDMNSLGKRFTSWNDALLAKNAAKNENSDSDSTESTDEN